MGFTRATAFTLEPLAGRALKVPVSDWLPVSEKRTQNNKPFSHQNKENTSLFNLEFCC